MGEIPIEEYALSGGPESGGVEPVFGQADQPEGFEDAEEFFDGFRLEGGLGGMFQPLRGGQGRPRMVAHQHRPLIPDFPVHEGARVPQGFVFAVTPFNFSSIALTLATAASALWMAGTVFSPSHRTTR